MTVTSLSLSSLALPGDNGTPSSHIAGVVIISSFTPPMCSATVTLNTTAKLPRELISPSSAQALNAMQEIRQEDTR